MSGTVGLPDVAYLCALASLPNATPARLAAMAHLHPRDALAAVAAGRWGRLGALGSLLHPQGRRADERTAWRDAAMAIDPADAWTAHRRAGVDVRSRWAADVPPCLATDPAPPEVVFLRGDPELLANPSVAIVGTRRCTRYGRDLALDLGRRLSGLGLVVVSGLAAGIDAAAHRGALDGHRDGGAPPVGVVGTGLDVPYPRRNAALWDEVADAGLLLGEYPLGTPPAPWRFPARNRLIVAASDVVVVVESHVTGGALITAREALARGRTVLSVPGPVHSPASRGTNLLLSEGAHPCLDLDDVVCALGLATIGPDARVVAPATDGAGAVVLDALGWTPATLDQLALRTGMAVGELSLALARLASEGRLVESAGRSEQVVP